MMKVAPFWASVALSFAPSVLAQQPTGTSSAPSTTSSSTAPSCTASLITKLCDYKSPGPYGAVAIGSREDCSTYCFEHQPCEFTIFYPGNPYLEPQPGTCWLYPGEKFDESAGDKDSCGGAYLEVFGKPECTGGSATPTAGGCAATATPSPVAQTCDYPAPETCFETCVASESSSKCLGYCADAEDCSYVIYRPGEASGGPHTPGTCWIYPNGTYDASAGKTCSGDTELYVYDNPCPKPKASSSGSVSPSPTTATSEAAESGPAAKKENSASTRLVSFGSLAMGVVVFVWLGF